MEPCYPPEAVEIMRELAHKAPPMVQQIPVDDAINHLVKLTLDGAEQRLNQRFSGARSPEPVGKYEFYG